MARIVITSGPTRQYLDPVRYLSNASSGRMGAALAKAGLALGHEIHIISGPVQVRYPRGAQVEWVTTTPEMLTATRRAFSEADGLIGAAAPCDYMPERVLSEKMAKTGRSVEVRLIETPDIVATLASRKRKRQWVVGFALETEDRRFRAIVKMQRKACDLMVSNGPTAIDATHNEVEVLSPDGATLAMLRGPKTTVAKQLFRVIQSRLIDRP